MYVVTINQHQKTMKMEIHRYGLFQANILGHPWFLWSFPLYEISPLYLKWEQIDIILVLDKTCSDILFLNKAILFCYMSSWPELTAV